LDRLYYTPREIAEILGISDDAVLDLIHRDELPALHVSARIIRIPIAGFDAWRGGRRAPRRRVAIRDSSENITIGEGETLPEGTQVLRR
jgi:excisionase family DNA binding protein